MANVFISYQRSDSVLLAHCLRYALHGAGHNPFIDTGSIPGGVAFASEIDEGISRSDLVIVLIGPAFDWERLRQPNSVIAFEWRRARFYGCAILPVSYQGAGFSVDSLPSELRWLSSLNSRFVLDKTLSADVDELVSLVEALAHPPRPSARVLWIDEDPKNNIGERRYLRQRGLSFDNVVSTDEAIEQLRNSGYDLVITDLGRYSSDERSYSAGLDALRWIAEVRGPPVIVYANERAIHLREEVVALGGFGSTNSPRELYAMIDRALGRALPSDDTPLQR